MNKYKKVFHFSGTINGTNYFLRQLLAAVLAFIGGFSIGIGIAGMEYTTAMSVLLLLGIVVAASGIWISLATMYKRFSAFFPEQASVLAITLFSFQTISTMFDSENVFGIILKLILALVGVYLIFANSKIENHEG
jgi:hypothetical protein